MPDSLHDRLQALYRRMQAFPEQSRCEHGTHLKPDAYVAFLDLRKLIETEVLPALYGRPSLPEVDLEACAEAVFQANDTWDGTDDHDERLALAVIKLIRPDYDPSTA